MILPLEQQVCSLESARRLKELGCSQESLFYWVKHKNKNSLWNHKPDCLEGKYSVLIASAYTVAELGELLPEDTPSDKYSDGYICYMLTSEDGDTHWDIKYYNDEENVENDNFDFKSFIANTEAEARAKMLVYLVENNLINKEKP